MSLEEVLVIRTADKSKLQIRKLSKKKDSRKRKIKGHLFQANKQDQEQLDSNIILQIEKQILSQVNRFPNNQYRETTNNSKVGPRSTLEAFHEPKIHQ